MANTQTMSTNVFTQTLVSIDSDVYVEFVVMGMVGDSVDRVDVMDMDIDRDSEGTDEDSAGEFFIEIEMEKEGWKRRECGQLHYDGNLCNYFPFE